MKWIVFYSKDGGASWHFFDFDSREAALAGLKNVQDYHADYACRMQPLSTELFAALTGEKVRA